MTAPVPATQRAHRASYSTDKRNGGYIIRVEGPNADKFAGRVVPVSTKAGGEHTEKLERLIWTGTDQISSAKVALYKFVAQPKATVDEVVF